MVGREVVKDGSGDNALREVRADAGALTAKGQFGARPSPLKVISLGAGVQSTTVALMSAVGELPPVDCAIFADTGAEPLKVYDHLKWLIPQLPFPVHIVSSGNIRDDILEGRTNGRPPMHILNPNGTKGFTRRQCTGDYKIDPIRKKVRELIGLKPRQRAPKTVHVEQWIGISMDEAIRMKPSPHPFIEHRWPLIELRLSRRDCLAWLDLNGFPTPPKSACTFCPFHSDSMWRDMKTNDRTSWDDAVGVDAALRRNKKILRGTPFLHSSCLPLDKVDLSTAEDRGQLNMFLNECEGMCGV